MLKKKRMAFEKAELAALPTSRVLQRGPSGEGAERLPEETKSQRRLWATGARVYVLVVGVVGTAAVLRWLLGSLFEVTNPCITFYPALAVAALVGGARAGLMATVLSALAMDVFFMEPRGSLMTAMPGDWAELVLFASAGGLISWMAHKVERAHKQEAEALERKRGEEALRTSESTLRSFYESAPLMMGVVDVPADNSDIIHIYDNPATDRFFGRTRGSTAGHSALQLGAPKEVVKRWIENYRLAEREERPVQFEYWHPRDSDRVWLSAVVARIGPGGGGRTRFSYAVSDVTERKRGEEALRASEERLTLATLGGDLGIWDWDVARDKAYLSRKYYEMIGYQEDEVQPNIEFFRGLVHPEDWAPIESSMAALFRGESDYSIIEYRLRRKTGEHRWIRGVGKVVARDERGQPLRMAGVIADITAQKNGEAAMREQLAHASRVSMMGELASSITHELGQPLAAMVCNVDAAELLLNQAPPNLRELRNIMSDIREDSQRAGEVIQSMRKLLLRKELERQALEVNLLAEEVLRLVKEDAASRKIKIKTEFSPRLPAVTGNRVQLQQVVLNFVMMAQQPPERRRLTVGTNLAGNGELELSVSDLGPGIEPCNLPRLFQPFFTTKATGLGIGLSVAERIVTAHEGRVWAENRPTGGAVFHMALPVANGKSISSDKETAVPESL